MKYFENATTNTFCNENILGTITGFPDDFHQGFCNPYAHLSHELLSLGLPQVQQVGIPEDINEWMVGSQTDIRRKHRLLKKLKSGTSIKHDFVITSSETSLVLPTCQEPTKNTYFPIERDNPLKRFIDVLNLNDKNILLEALVDVKHLSYVANIGFENNENPTLIIRLSKMDRETEEKIYQIEYDLLKIFKNNIDFLVLPE